jgi:type I restriction enzyme S subunit
MKSELKNICDLINEKISANELINDNLASTYVSTESMLPNKRGITKPSSIPSKGTTTAYKKDDVLVSNIRPYFKKIWSANYDGVCSNDVLVFRAKNTADANFLYYVLANDDFFVYSMATSKGTKMPRGDKASIMKYEVESFDLNTQRKIASILKPIDKKIELNNAINNNLEQQAMALFKSRFIDFEPFDGKVPKAWINGVLGDFVEIKRGGSPRPIQNFLSDSGFHWLKISDATGISSPFINEIKEYINEAGLKKTVYLKSGSLVLSNSATPGLPKILDIDTCIHDGWLYFPSSKFSNEYLYLYFKYIRDNLIALGNGSVFTNLKTDILKNYPTYLPTEDVLKKFDGLVQPIFSMILSKTREIKRLAEIRDTLLPKLMSGELDVSYIKL